MGRSPIGHPWSVDAVTMATQLARMHFCFLPLMLHCPESSAEDGTTSEGPRPLLGAWWPVTGLLPAKLYPGGKNQKLNTYYPQLLQTDKGQQQSVKSTGEPQARETFLKISCL